MSEIAKCKCGADSIRVTRSKSAYTAGAIRRICADVVICGIVGPWQPVGSKADAAWNDLMGGVPEEAHQSPDASLAKQVATLRAAVIGTNEDLLDWISESHNTLSVSELAKDLRINQRLEDLEAHFTGSTESLETDSEPDDATHTEPECPDDCWWVRLLDADFTEVSRLAVASTFRPDFIEYRGEVFRKLELPSKAAYQSLGEIAIAFPGQPLRPEPSDD